MTRNLSIFKIAILNDLLNAELTKIDIPKVINPEVQAKLRNMKKSTDIFLSFTDKTFAELETQETFGDFCDQIDELINEQLKQIVE